MTTTARTDIATGLKTLLDSFKAANPTLMRSTFAAHPPGYTNDMPSGWVEMGDEQVRHDAGIRTRTMTPAVVLADWLTDNAETSARLDAAIDALLDHLTANPHIAPNTAWDQMSISVSTEQLPDGRWHAEARFDFGNVTIQEGRL